MARRPRRSYWQVEDPERKVLVDKWLVGPAGSQPPTTRDLQLAQSILEVVDCTRDGRDLKWFQDGLSSAGVMAALERLAFLDRWQLALGDGEEEILLTREHLVALVLVDLVWRTSDRLGWYPSRFYSENFGIMPPRLRQAVRAGRLKNLKMDGETLYPFHGVRLLWPQDVTFEPPRHPVFLDGKRLFDPPRE